MKETDVAKDTKELDDKMAVLEKLLENHEKKLRSLAPVACSPDQLDQQQKEINVSSLPSRFSIFSNLLTSCVKKMYYSVNCIFPLYSLELGK